MEQKIKRDISLGKNIKRLRLSCGLTQEQTTARMQVLGCTLSRGAYAKLEAGIQNIRVEELLALKEIFTRNLKNSSCLLHSFAFLLVFLEIFFS